MSLVYRATSAKREVSRWFVVIFLYAVLLLTACTTIPKYPEALADEPLREFSLLPPGGSLYLYADLSGEDNKESLAKLFPRGQNSDAEKIIARTDSAAASFYGEREGRAFLAAASGKFPRSAAEMGLGVSSGWKKLKSARGMRYWRSDAAGLSLSIGRQLALVSDGDPFAIQESRRRPLETSRGTVLPEGFASFGGYGGASPGAVLSGWIPSPRPVLSAFLQAQGAPIQIPAEDFFFGLFRAAGPEKGWELAMRIKLPSESQSKAVAALISMARIFLSGAGSAAEDAREPNLVRLLFANPPSVDGDALVIRSPTMDDEETALLFRSFFVYSTHTDN